MFITPILMFNQLEHVATVLNMFQDDTKNLSDCVRGWLRLVNDGNIKEDVRAAIDSRFRKTASVWHILAFMLDNRDRGDWPELPSDLADEAREAVLEMGEANIHAMAAFEIEDTSVFPMLAFTKSIKDKMEPGKYWSYVAKVTSAGPKMFADMMVKVFSLPPSSAGIERIFSTAGLVQSKLRNRLEVEKVGRLVGVSRLLSLNAESGTHALDSLEEGFDGE